MTFLIGRIRHCPTCGLRPRRSRLVPDEPTCQVAQLRPLLAKVRQLEIELQHLVFDLYGLTPEEVQLLRSTAPPHDPLALVEAASVRAAGEEQ